MKLLIVALPLGLLALWLGVGAARGKLSRRSANVAVALCLLVYALATASLGIFWVARMDLPVFDWHYLFGYAFLLVLLVHVALELQSLAAHVRRQSPSWLLSADGRRFGQPVRLLSLATLLAVVLLPAFAWLLGRSLPAERARVRGAWSASPRGADSESVWIEKGGKRLGVPEYLWAESRHTRAGVLRAPRMAPPRPAAVRSYPGTKPLSLPRPSRGVRATPSDAGARIVAGSLAPRIELGTLSDLLHHSYGVTRRSSGDLLLRAAASAGALYPTDLFVVSRSGGPLSAGVFYYDPEAHALVAVGGANAADEAVAALPASSPLRTTPLLVVFGSSFDRTVFKYEARSYRYVGLDAGHAALNLLSAGQALGVPCTLEPWFDDAALSAAMGLSADGEGVVLAAGCGAEAEARARAAPGHAPVSLPESADDTELTRLSHQLTSWRLTAESAADAGPPVTSRAAGRHSDPLALIRQRRSFRGFSAAGVARADLDAVLDAALDASGALGLPRLVDVLVTVRAVEGLEAGSFAHGGKLELLRADPEVATRVEKAGLDQEVLGRAAFVVAFALGDSANGARDFRHALLQAGLAGEAIYLEATARGLGACGVGAFFDDDLGQLLPHHGKPAKALYLVALGKK